MTDESMSYLEALTEIKRLKEALEQQPCEDCISRQAVLKVLKNNRYRFNISQEGYCEGKVLWSENLIKDNACKEIEQLPSVTPQEKTGHWIIKDGKEQGYDIGGIKTWYIQIMCDKCGFIKTAIEGHTGQYHFCPNCGARMVEQQEKSEYEHDHEVVKAYNDGQAYILDKIKAEVEAKCCITIGRENDGAITLYDIFEIIDKYRGGE